MNYLIQKDIPVTTYIKDKKHRKTISQSPESYVTSKFFEFKQITKKVN